jgi:phospholipid/cholesterol/gamma-HCH transport system permease protein
LQTSDNTGQPPAFRLEDDGRRLCLVGDWTIQEACPDFEQLRAELQRATPSELSCDASELGQWDSALPSFLLLCHGYCQQSDIAFKVGCIPEGAQRLLELSTAVAIHQRPPPPTLTLAQRLAPRERIGKLVRNTEDYLAFIGEVTIALGKFAAGRSNTRRADLLNFLYEAGPDALGIVTLTSFLVGMILAYLGAAQLAQFGAQIYVADLVTIGMLREMGALMVAVVMAGRTGAAYAAQLGTMQTREEIDAVVTLGISPVEFLVLPRMMALVLIMPLLVLYANVVGIFGGAIVAAGMDVSLMQFFQQLEKVLSFNHLATGLVKSLFFGLLIAIAGCRAGIQCGRSSAAVGQAATNAVVTSIVYLIVADATFNILFQELGI